MTCSPDILPLEVDGVRLERGGRRVIDGITFTLEQGSITAVMGPNGAGKSLLLRICHGLVTPDAGSVRWAVSDSEARRRQAFVFQRPVMLRRSARANVEYALATRPGENGSNGATARRRADEVLARVGLSAAASQPARTLSGGEQQRLALARVWAIEPDVLFLDEPTASLDPTATQAIEDVIRAIAATGTKIIWTTHDLAQARRHADEVLFLDRGKLAERAPAEDFFASPKTAAARAFLDGRLSW